MRRREDGRVVRAVLEVLESRQLLSTYYVSEEGDDGNDGSEAHPWRTIQKAADSVVGGDVVEVLPGQYSGFSVGVRRSARGTADKPIVFNGNRVKVRGDGGGYSIIEPIIASANRDTPDGIYVAPGSAYVVIEGFGIGNWNTE